MRKHNVPESPATIYNNMSHHYRRLFGAKSVVDTSLPNYLKSKQSQLRHRASSTQSLNKLSLCQSNQVPCKHSSLPLQTKKHLSSSTMSLCSKGQTDCPRLKKFNENHTRSKGDLLDYATTNPMVPFKPRILKSNAESKLKKLQGIYFPPRKKPIQTWETMNVEIDSEDNIKPWIRHSLIENKVNPVSSIIACDETTLDVGSHSSTSSKDSAYNEGEVNSSHEGSRGPSPGCSNQQKSSPKLWTIQKKNRRRNDNSMYVKFLRDITDDILTREIYTNKALKLVFQKHINNNINQLDLDRMKQEIEILSNKIGIPINDKYDKLEYGLGNNIHETINSNTRDNPNIINNNNNKLDNRNIKNIDNTGNTRNTTEQNYSMKYIKNNKNNSSMSSTVTTSSFDIEKELEELNNFTDIEMNSNEIEYTLNQLNINPKIFQDNKIAKTLQSTKQIKSLPIKQTKKLKAISQIPKLLIDTNKQQTEQSNKETENNSNKNSLLLQQQLSKEKLLSKINKNIPKQINNKSKNNNDENQKSNKDMDQNSRDMKSETHHNNHSINNNIPTQIKIDKEISENSQSIKTELINNKSVNTFNKNEDENLKTMKDLQTINTIEQSRQIFGQINEKLFKNNKNDEDSENNDSKNDHRNDDSSHSDHGHDDSGHSDHEHDDSGHSDREHDDSGHSDREHDDSGHSDREHDDSSNIDNRNDDISDKSKEINEIVNNLDKSDIEEMIDEYSNDEFEQSSSGDEEEVEEEEDVVEEKSEVETEDNEDDNDSSK